MWAHVNALLFKFFSQYSVSAGMWRPSTEYCRVADTRPNRVTEPSIGSALFLMGQPIFFGDQSILGKTKDAYNIYIGRRPAHTWGGRIYIYLGRRVQPWTRYPIANTESDKRCLLRCIWSSASIIALCISRLSLKDNSLLGIADDALAAAAAAGCWHRPLHPLCSGDSLVAICQLQQQQPSLHLIPTNGCDNERRPPLALSHWPTFALSNPTPLSPTPRNAHSQTED